MSADPDCLAALTPPAAEPEPPGRAELERRLEELAALTPLDYELRRQAEARALGLRITVLDAEVEKRRVSQARDPGKGELFPDEEPWPAAVDGARLLDEIADAVARFVRFPSEAARDAVALWAVFAHAHDAFSISPLLAIESPEKRSGKTTLLSVLGLLVPRPLPAVNCTAAVLFRAIEKWRPTVLIDEGDTFLRDADDLRGILNGGHNRASAFVLRTTETEGDYEPRRFHVWAPKVIALIGDLPDTLQDRAIVVPMRRRLPSEHVERFRADRTEWAAPMRRRAARWAADSATRLADADPGLPAELHDRAADNWRPLIAIADLAGADWPARARAAAMALSGEIEEESPAVMLLADCCEIFERRAEPAISPSELADELARLDGRPWADWRGGRAITARAVGRLLSNFGIRSHHGSKARLFRREDFEDVWRRYVPESSGDQNVTNVTALKTKLNSRSQTSRPPASRDVCEGEKHYEINDVTFVTFETGGDGGKNTKSRCERPSRPAPASDPSTLAALQAVQGGAQSEGALAAELGIGAGEAWRLVERLKGEGLLEVGDNGALLVAPKGLRLLGTLPPDPPGEETAL